ncbi:Leucine-rich repeat-containing protein 58, partial [Armadillidium vulgare]
MYYSSETTDSDNALEDSSSLDLSYLLLDSEAIGVQLKNSVQEQRSHKDNLFREKLKLTAVVTHLTNNEPTNNEELQDLSVRKKSYKVESSFEDRERVSEDEIIFRDENTEKLLLNHNLLLALPFEISLFPNLKFLDLSNNNLTHINDFLLVLVNLQTLYLKNNSLGNESLPKDFSCLSKLRELNLSGNQFTRIPSQIYQITNLKYLYMGCNAIGEILPDIKNLQNIQVLHLGGNNLERVPDELGQLHKLGVLALCNNKLRRLPRVISNLTSLRSLLLHQNNLCCLPVGIVKLRGLTELSLRDNPLVNKFVTCCAKEIMYTPPSLLELAARVIKLKNIKYEKGDIPAFLDAYVNSGQKCVNPKCKGMYFTSCVEHIKFVDFCGKYRVPLMHYLCSSKCSSSTPSYYKTRSDSESEEEGPNSTLKRVLLRIFQYYEIVSSY